MDEKCKKDEIKTLVYEVLERFLKEKFWNKDDFEDFKKITDEWSFSEDLGFDLLDKCELTMDCEGALEGFRYDGADTIGHEVVLEGLYIDDDAVMKAETVGDFVEVVRNSVVKSAKKIANKIFG